MQFDPLSAVRALAAESGPEWDWAEVRVRRVGTGWELCHRADAGRAGAELILLEVSALLDWADTAADGSFRPLRGAPNLRDGWICRARDESELEDALNRLYPGGVADWWAVRSGEECATSFRAYVGRQTGIYRAAHALAGGAAEAAVRACCHARFCLKRRRWPVESMGVDPETEKSRIPCLEPCAVMLEMARRAAKLESGPVKELRIPEGDVGTLLAALEMAVAGVPDGPGGPREGDLGSGLNRRRIQLLLERLRPELGPVAPNTSESH